MFCLETLVGDIVIVGVPAMPGSINAGQALDRPANFFVANFNRLTGRHPQHLQFGGVLEIVKVILD